MASSEQPQKYLFIYRITKERQWILQEILGTGVFSRQINEKRMHHSLWNVLLMLWLDISYLCFLVSPTAVVLINCRIFIGSKNDMYNVMFNILMYVYKSCIKHVWLERRLVCNSGLYFLTLNLNSSVWI